jgi:threonine/homoserine/homoserine lactone efflux protein
MFRRFARNSIMAADTFFSSSLLFAYSAYFVACASPGPSILAIMGMAMNAGRRPALTFAMGVMCGSMFWAVLAALGLSATLARYSQLLIFLKLAGGAYLLWLAVKSARAALKASSVVPTLPKSEALPKRLYLRGLGFHLTNPKAILTWLSIVSLALPQGGTASHALLVVAGCNVIGFVVFGGYALLFSTPAVRRFYVAIRRWLEATLAIVFGVAGIKMLAFQT